MLALLKACSDDNSDVSPFPLVAKLYTSPIKPCLVAGRNAPSRPYDTGTEDVYIAV